MFDAKAVANRVIMAHYEETGEALLEASSNTITESLQRHFHENSEIEYYSVLAILMQMKEQSNYRKHNSIKSDIQ